MRSWDVGKLEGWILVSCYWMLDTEWHKARGSRRTAGCGVPVAGEHG
jgi:hypothetical protein